METFKTKLILSFLFLYVVQISGELFECYGPDCPTFSLPETREQDDSGVIKCNGTEFIVKDPKDCHQFYYCKPNDKESNTTAATHFKCPQGYGFQEEWQYCVPEHLVKNCSAVYCPPFIYDGVIPDPQDCSAYYRCLYGFPARHKCKKENIFDAETGECKPYKEKPDCLKKPEQTTTTTVTTTAKPTTVTTSTTMDSSTTTTNSTNVNTTSTKI